MLNCYDTQYVTSQGETWDTISIDFYGTPYKVAELIECNPSLADVLIFEEGVKLNIPIMEEELPATLPPWKRGQ